MNKCLKMAFFAIDDDYVFVASASAALVVVIVSAGYSTATTYSKNSNNSISRRLRTIFSRIRLPRLLLLLVLYPLCLRGPLAGPAVLAEVVPRGRGGGRRGRRGQEGMEEEDQVGGHHRRGGGGGGGGGRRARGHLANKGCDMKRI